LVAGAPVIGERVRLRQFRRRPSGEVVPRIRIPLALAYHFGNGHRVGFLDQCQPGPDHLMDPTRYVLMEKFWMPSEARVKKQPKGFRAGFAPDLTKPRRESTPMGFLS
jgi:hypothetical protein